MRLYDSLTRGKVELPAPPGPIRMYFCGRRSTSASTSATRGRSCSPCGCRSWLERTRLRRHARPQHHRRRRQGLRRGGARRGGEPRLPSGQRAGSWRTPTGSGWAGRTIEPRASETMPEIIAFIEELLAHDLAYAAGGTCTSASPAFEDYGGCRARKPDEMVAQEPNELKEDPRDFALWKAQKEGEDAAWDSPWGPGRPGWHIECSAMAEKHLGPAFEIHGGGNDLVFPHHENELAQSCGLGHQFAQIWMHNGMLELDAREDVEVARQRRHASQNVLDTWGRETLLVYFLTAHWRSRSTSRTTCSSRRRRRRRPFGTSSALRPSRRPTEPGSASRPRSTTTSRRRRRSRSCTNGATTSCSRGRSTSSGSRRSPSRRRRRAEAVALAEEREAGTRERATSRTADRLRGEIAALGWEVRDVAGRLPARPAASDPRARLRPAAGVRGAPRPARRARAARERAGTALGGVASRRAAPRVQVAAERELTELAGTRDHQGIVALCEPYRYADAYELVRPPAASARLPGRRDRPAQPRRRLPKRGGGGSDRPRPARTPLRAGHAGRLPRLRGRRRAPAGRRRPEPRPVRRGRERA